MPTTGCLDGASNLGHDAQDPDPTFPLALSGFRPHETTTDGPVHTPRAGPSLFGGFDQP